MIASSVSAQGSSLLCSCIVRVQGVHIRAQGSRCTEQERERATWFTPLTLISQRKITPKTTESDLAPNLKGNECTEYIGMPSEANK